MNAMERAKTASVPPSSRRFTAVTTVAEVMTTTPHTIGAEQKLAHAFEVMRTNGIRHLPVLEAGRLVGILSQRDLYFVESIAGVNRRVDAVSEAMSTEIYSVAPGDLVVDVAREMAEHKYGCALVVDRGHLVGIFTATDALRLLGRVDVS